MSGRKIPNKGEEDNGLIFNVQKFSLHDGAGIRTLVFFKGCPRKCKWCSNPEGQSYSPELAFNTNKCIGTAECDWCMRACKLEAIREGADGKIEIDKNACDNCGECAEACPSKALELFGAYMTVDEVISVVEEDSGFYARSGGGLTLSGGEPLSQAEFAAKLLKTARARGIDTAIETTGHCAWEDLANICPHVNQIFFDIKSMDADKHKAGIGVGSERILENLRKLSKTFPEIPLTVRTPIIPGFNDSPEDIRAIVNFLSDTSRACEYELLPYHRFGEPKYRQIGKEYPLQEIEPPSQERMTILREVIRSCDNILNRPA